INNAGFGIFGKMHETSDADWHAMFNVNVHGVFNCTKAVVPAMIKQQSGHIVNISSIAGKVAVVDGAGYSATKFAVTAMSHAMFRELRQYNIKVSVVFPGSVNTHFFDNVEHKLKADDMIQPADLAQSILHLVNTPVDFLPFELEVRTMRAK
ncbi:MAG TPA: SDR family NAD(P)-dependent oxidoreductase, partial [Chitinophagales bacterium]|nr:SDR family NAD(P)-dependent oxidoreductase [Chitinophagales bacterium]